MFDLLREIQKVGEVGCGSGLGGKTLLVFLVPLEFVREEGEGPERRVTHGLCWMVGGVNVVVEGLVDEEVL